MFAIWWTYWLLWGQHRDSLVIKHPSATLPPSASDGNSVCLQPFSPLRFECLHSPMQLLPKLGWTINKIKMFTRFCNLTSHPLICLWATHVVNVSLPTKTCPCVHLYSCTPVEPYQKDSNKGPLGLKDEMRKVTVTSQNTFLAITSELQQNFTQMSYSI